MLQLKAVVIGAEGKNQNKKKTCRMENQGNELKDIQEKFQDADKWSNFFMWGGVTEQSI